MALAFVLASVAALSCTATRRVPGAWCERDSDCASLHCEVTYNTCVDPVDAATSDDGGPSDDGAVDLAPTCTPATFVTDCADSGAPICSSGSCRACTGPSDDPICAARSAATPVCAPLGPSAGRCVACRPTDPSSESSACTYWTPICGSDGTCRACSSHADCGSGICIADGPSKGNCAPAAQIALVDNGGIDPVSCMNLRSVRDGNSAATAYCDIAEVVPTFRRYALVRGSAQPYSALTLTDRAINIVGPGPAASPTARIFTTGMHSVSTSVSGGSGRVEVILDGLDLGGAGAVKALSGLFATTTGGAMSDAVITLRNSIVHDCIQPGVSTSRGIVTLTGNTITGSGDAGVKTSFGTVTLTGNTITGSTGAGVSTTDGSLTITRCTLRGNMGGGLSVKDTAYLIENNLIAGNGINGPGVAIVGYASGSFLFNTIAGNLSSSGGSGVDGSSAISVPLLQASIFWNNTKSAGGTSTVNCKVSTSDLDDGVAPSSTGNFSLLPLFVDTVGYRLQPGSPCKDKVLLTDISAAVAPTLDIDAEPRPKGAGYDVGCDEL